MTKGHRHTEEGGRRTSGQGLEEPRIREDRVDFFVRCACDNLICRQDKQDPTVFRFKEKEFYIEVTNPSRLSTRCRRCGRTVIVPNKDTEENVDIVRQARKLKREMAKARQGRASPGQAEA